MTTTTTPSDLGEPTIEMPPIKLPFTLSVTLDQPIRMELAYNLGAMRALGERTAGWLHPAPAPLDGEWDGDPIWVTLARSLGVIPPATKSAIHDELFEVYAESCWAIAASYENGYSDGWAS